MLPFLNGLSLLFVHFNMEYLICICNRVYLNNLVVWNKIYTFILSVAWMPLNKQNASRKQEVVMALSVCLNVLHVTLVNISKYLFLLFLLFVFILKCNETSPVWGSQILAQTHRLTELTKQIMNEFLHSINDKRWLIVVAGDRRGE